MHAIWTHSRRVEPGDFRTCRRLLRGGSRSFYAAGWLLPRSLSEPATALYAFCRVADDTVDDAAAQLHTLDELRNRLDRAYAGRPVNAAADRALASVVARYELPRAIPEALLEGFEWDISGRRYETLDALEAYALRVAGTVGIMMAWLMGVRTRELLARACDLGIAMQLTNIARDVGEDARAGRLYLPTAWLTEAGVDPDAWLRTPVCCPQIAAATATLLGHADALYERADAGINALPVQFRAGIRAARSLYAEIGHKLARRGFDSITTRTRVGTAGKLRLLVRSLAPYRSGAAIGDPAVPAAAALIEVIGTAESTGAAAPGGFMAVLDLIARLEARDRAAGFSTDSARRALPAH
jgi:phytoene synthase